MQALREQALLDTQPEERFDRITRLAQQMFGVQIALVSLVDAERQWFKSRQGLDACETGRDVSFCGHAILNKEIFHIADASLDQRFANNPLVLGPPNIRFYAGAPLATLDGYRIGTLCIIDDKPRQLTQAELSALRDLADCVEAEINSRHQGRQHDALLALNEITSLVTLDHQLLLRSALHMGCRYLGLPFGIISRIAGEDYEVKVQVSPDGALSDGQHFPLGQTYCSLTLRANDVLAIDDMGQSAYASHPCYQAFQLESYIGAPLRLNGEVYGTLNFSSAEKRIKRHFTEADIEFVQLLSRWVATTMQHWNLDQTLKQEQHLRDVITRAQSKFISAGDRHVAFDALLADILLLTGSEYGFIGEVLRSPAGEPYLKTYSITNIAWDDATRAFYEANVAKGMEFSNLKTLFGAALTSGEPVISNQPAHDTRRGGLPAGHPALNAFLGIPVHYENELVAMIGLANRPGGYDAELVGYLSPLLITIAQLVQAARIQKLHHESEERYLLTLNSAKLATWDWDIVSGHVNFNERWAKIRGCNLADLTPHIETWKKCIHVEDIAGVNRLLEEHFSGRSAMFEAEYRVLNVAKEWIWILDRGAIVARDDRGEPLRMASTQINITQRKLAELEVRESEQRFRYILDTCPTAARIAKSGGREVVFFNRGYAALINAHISQVSGVDPASYYARREDYDDILLRLGRGEEILNRLVELKLPSEKGDGNKWALASFLPLQYQGGPAVLGWFHDITERIRIERMKSEFVSTVSHELRTPLTAISGSLGLIAGGVLGQLPEQANEMINIAHKNSQRLTFLINDLLDMEKLVEGKLSFDMQMHSLNLLLEQALESNRSYGAERRVTLQLSGHRQDVSVNVDSQRFMQVLSNLLSNAVKYSPHDGVVLIAVSQRDSLLRVSVNDHGPGIPQEFRSRIFQKFAQADSSDTRQKGGTGLGLAITRELVERMGGSIGFDSVEGEGATFYVEFPLLPVLAG